MQTPLRPFFLEQSQSRPERIQRIIEENAQRKGWLVFATHDVCEAPTRFGVTPAAFANVVDWAVSSGARILTFSRGFDAILKS
mgnify:CR=1 FL=1